jgi:CRP-like cAMP-binding protein
MHSPLHDLHSYKTGTHALMDDPDMSVPLKKDITTFLYRQILSNVSFLKNATPDVVTRLCSLLVLEVYMPSEYIFQKGDRGRHLYIIKRGKVSVLRNEVNEPDDEVAELAQNQFFGETALLSGIGRGHGGHRSVSTRAVTIAELLQLSSYNFNKIILEFPLFKEDMLNLTLRSKTSSMNTIGLGKESADDKNTSDGSSANPNSGNNTSNLSSDQLTSLIRACMLEMRRDLEHNMNDRFMGLEERLNDTIESIGN